MARVHDIQNSLNAGEWSPLLEGRTDLAKYHSAAKTVENMVCFKHGGAGRRPGTRFVAEAKISAKKTRIIPFIFSTIQAYVIEMGDQYMRFYRNNGRVESPPGTPVEIVSPYLEAELFDIHFTQSADVLYLAHPNHAPMKLSRLSDIAWFLSVIAFQNGPFLPERTDVTFTPSATTGVITIVASAPFFDPTMALSPGSFLRLKFAGAYGLAVISVFTDSTHVTASVVKPFTASGIPSTVFQEGAWSYFRGFPGAVTLFQQRSWWAGSSNNPDTIWGSQTSQYENMDPGTALPAEAITFTLASNAVNAIRWLAPSRALLAGSTGQEWNISGGASETDPITPANPNAKPETTHGSNKVSPIQVHNAVIFLQRAGNRLREYTFDFYTDSYSAPDLTLVAEHIVAGGIVQMDYQQERDSIVWAIRADGTLLGMTYERPQDVEAWHRHVTVGKFESVAVIPHPTVNEDQTWVVVNRTIGGVTKRYIEFLDTQGGFYGNLETDAGLTYSGAAVATLSGLSHLEGQTVDILGNGSVYPPQVVTGGAVTGLSPMVTQAEVGLHFDSTILSMRPEAGGDSGTAQGARKRFNAITVRLYQSVGVTINGDRMEFRKAGDAMDKPVPMFSGDQKVTTLGWDTDGRVEIKQTQPLPITVLAIIGELSVGD